ncbi:MAG: FG-GAP-like repeat-containing protein [Hyphomicrobiales bacterium]
MSFVDDASNKTVLSGKGFVGTMAGGNVTDVTAGTITGVKITANGILALDASGLSVNAATLFDTYSAAPLTPAYALFLKGDDTIKGTSFADVIIGDAGNDTLDGGLGADVLKGGTGNDTYIVDNAGDTVSEAGGDGIDLVKSLVGYDLSLLAGTVENLTLTGKTDANAGGNAVANIIVGNAKQNVLEGRGGADTLDGGAGIDTLSYADSDAGVTIAINGSKLTVGSGGHAQGDSVKNFENITGSAHNDSLTGDGKNNVLDGGAGDDTLTGGAGNDTYFVDSLGDTVVELAKGGTDGIVSSISYSIDSLINIENLSALASGGAIDLTGNSLANVLSGNGQANKLAGGGGNDILDGGSGDDTLTGGNGADKLIGGSGADSFAFAAVGDSKATSKGGFDSKQGDTIAAFESATEAGSGPHDVIDLSAIASDLGITLAFNGTTKSSYGVWSVAGSKTTTVFVDTTGDAVADMAMTISTKETLTAADFVLNTVTPPTPGSDVNVGTMSGSQGFGMTPPAGTNGPYAGQFGYAVAGVGDVNGDGVDDFAVSDPHANNGDNMSPQRGGNVYVVYGGSSLATALSSGGGALDFNNMNATMGVKILGNPGPTHSEFAGTSISGIGDVNGDGIDDLLIGAPGMGSGTAAANQGGVYVIYGSNGGLGTGGVIHLGSLGSSEGVGITGAPGVDHLEDEAGFSVASAGDVNGDGFADFIVGGPDAQHQISGYGASFLVYGAGSGLPSGLSGAATVTILGAENYDSTGFSVSGAGDINGDGYSDLIVGIPSRWSGGADPGLHNASWVIFGKAAQLGSNVGGVQTIDLANMTSADGFRIEGDTSSGYLGKSVSVLGDVNGDGYDDLAVSEPGQARSWIVYGNGTGNFGTLSGGINLLSLSDSSLLSFITTGKGAVLFHDVANKKPSEHIVGVGDVNGDGLEDFAVTDHMWEDSSGNTQVGRAYVVFGDENGFPLVVDTGTGTETYPGFISLDSMTPEKGFTISGAGEYDWLASSIAAAGDVNNDGFADIVVGAPLANGDEANLAGTGGAYVIYGGNFGATPQAVTLVATSASDRLFGTSLADSLEGTASGVAVMSAGAGNDSVVVHSNNFVRIKGGTGTDTLVVDSTEEVVLDHRVDGFEYFNLLSGSDLRITGLGAINSDASLVPGLSVADSTRQFVVTGDASDALILENIDPDGAGGAAATHVWQLAETHVLFDGSDAGTAGYNIYNLVQGGHAVATVAVFAALTDVTII